MANANRIQQLKQVCRAKYQLIAFGTTVGMLLGGLFAENLMELIQLPCAGAVLGLFISGLGAHCLYLGHDHPSALSDAGPSPFGPSACPDRFNPAPRRKQFSLRKLMAIVFVVALLTANLRHVYLMFAERQQYSLAVFKQEVLKGYRILVADLGPKLPPAQAAQLQSKFDELEQRVYESTGGTREIDAELKRFDIELRRLSAPVPASASPMPAIRDEEKQ